MKGSRLRWVAGFLRLAINHLDVGGRLADVEADSTVQDGEEGKQVSGATAGDGSVRIDEVDVEGQGVVAGITHNHDTEAAITLGIKHADDLDVVDAVTADERQLHVAGQEPVALKIDDIRARAAVNGQTD